MRVFGFLTGVVLIVCTNLFIVWIIASAITSGIKVLAGDCGGVYGIETVVAGDWFCIEESADD